MIIDSMQDRRSYRSRVQDCLTAEAMMFIGRFSARLLRRPGLGDYLFALAIIVAALLCRALIEAFTPGLAYFIIVLPSVVLAGLFCGTGPGILAAVIGGAAINLLSLGYSLYAWPPSNAVQSNALVYALASTTILWATSTVRFFAATTDAARLKLQDALASRDLLVREADHRIKNSLQLVTSLLRLQLGRVTDVDVKEALTAAITRVDAVANAHLALQQSPDLCTIEVDQMFEDLCRRIGSLNPAVTMCCHSDAGLWLNAEQAIPLGLIASELLTNALRHAFLPGKGGTVCLSISTNSGVLTMTVADGGAGLPTTPVRPGLGTTVINSLARQIGATVLSQSAPGDGTTIIIQLKLSACSKVSGQASPLDKRLSV